MYKRVFTESVGGGWSGSRFIYRHAGQFGGSSGSTYLRQTLRTRQRTIISGDAPTWTWRRYYVSLVLWKPRVTSVTPYQPRVTTLVPVPQQRRPIVRVEPDGASATTLMQLIRPFLQSELLVLRPNSAAAVIGEGLPRSLPADTGTAPPSPPGEQEPGDKGKEKEEEPLLTLEEEIQQRVKAVEGRLKGLPLGIFRTTVGQVFNPEPVSVQLGSALTAMASNNLVAQILVRGSILSVAALAEVFKNPSLAKAAVASAAAYVAANPVATLALAQVAGIPVGPILTKWILRAIDHGWGVKSLQETFTDDTFHG